jgi:hypothetical protein
MHTDAPAGQDAMGFAGLAALVSTVPDPAPAAATPRARSAPRGDRMLAAGIGIGLVALFRLLASGSAPVAPNLPTPVIVGPGTGTFTPLNFPQPNLAQPVFTTPTYATPPLTTPPFETRTITVPGSISEVKPPPGTDLWLSSSQILYCLAQQVRLDVMEPMIDTTSAAQLGGFNGLVDDYNLRCLNYRYRNTDMEAAQMRVAVLRPALSMQAKDQVAAWR